MKYTCKIELNDISPKIWREFQFHPDVTFHQLHNIIQVIMGWENYHLYEFHVNGQVIGLPDPTFAHMENRKVLNARREKVRELISHEKASFTYTYDFGDNWRHTITLLKIDSSAADPAPVCLGGARGCPPEDVGGVWGYRHMLEALLTPNHPERDHFLEWLGEEYDPERFSHDEVNALLHAQKSKLIPKPLLPQSGNKKTVKLTKSALNKYLKQMSQDQLAELVKACYSFSKDMEKFLAVRILGDEAAESLFHEYRKKVKHEFFPERGSAKLRLQEAEKAIFEFERLTGNKKYGLELKLVYVETGVSYASTYNVADERFYGIMEAMYAEIIETVNEDETAELFEEYEERISAIVSDTEGIGWGFHENLKYLYDQLRWI